MDMSTSIYLLPCEHRDETKVWYPLGWVWDDDEFFWWGSVWHSETCLCGIVLPSLY